MNRMWKSIYDSLPHHQDLVRAAVCELEIIRSDVEKEKEGAQARKKEVQEGGKGKNEIVKEESDALIVIVIKGRE